MGIIHGTVYITYINTSKRAILTIYATVIEEEWLQKTSALRTTTRTESMDFSYLELDKIQATLVVAGFYTVPLGKVIFTHFTHSVHYSFQTILTQK